MKSSDAADVTGLAAIGFLIGIVLGGIVGLIMTTC
jgi:hypothetical protein